MVFLIIINHSSWSQLCVLSRFFFCQGLWFVKLWQNGGLLALHECKRNITPHDCPEAVTLWRTSATSQRRTPGSRCIEPRSSYETYCFSPCFLYRFNKRGVRCWLVSFKRAGEQVFPLFPVFTLSWVNQLLVSNSQGKENKSITPWEPIYLQWQTIL